jgi:hypothetical protein
MHKPMIEPLKPSFKVCLNKKISDHPTKKASNMKISPICMLIGIFRKAIKRVIETGSELSIK